MKHISNSSSHNETEENVYYNKNTNVGGSVVRIKQQDVDSALYDKVFSFVLKNGALREGHRNRLVDRGITEDQIREYNLISSPISFQTLRMLEKTFSLNDLIKVPGLYINPKTNLLDCSADDGIIIPHKSLDGEIISLQLRRDTEEVEKRYRWISSSSFNGSSATIAPFFAGQNSDQIAFLTEGALKAITIEKHFKGLVIAAPGVNNWRTMLPILVEQKIKKVVIAFDTDMNSKETVARAAYEICQLLILEGFEVNMAVWSEKYKGIDDALRAKEKVSLIKDNELQVYLKSLKEKFSPKSDTWTEIGTETPVWPELSVVDLESKSTLPSIPENSVPDSLKMFAQDIAERTQVPWEYILSFLVVVLSSLIGAKIKVRPKKFDPWTVVVNLWGGLVAAASTLKSPAFGAILKLLKRLDARFQAEFQNAVIKWTPEKKILQARLKQVEKNIADALEENPDANLIHFEEQMRAIEQELITGEPIQRRLYTNDATIEKIGELLPMNRNGLLVFRDEILGLLRAMEKPGREGERQFYLEAWSGDASYQIDRIGRGSIFIPVLLLSVFGAIQPEPLASYLSELQELGLLQDGFIQRLQILFMPKMKEDWINVDRYPDKMAEDRIFKIFEKITAITLPKDEQGNEVSFSLQFDSEAQEYFNIWLQKLELRLRTGKILNAALASHLGKYRSLLPALATIFYVCDTLDLGLSITSENQIPLSYLKMAATWCDILEAHAENLYSEIKEGPTTEARYLLAKIKEGRVAHKARIRDLANKNWRGLSDSKVIKKAAEELESLGILRIVEERKGRGHPSLRLYIHPDLRSGGSL